MRTLVRSFVFAAGVILAGTACLPAGRVWAADTYTIDPVHSNFGFSVTHMMVSTVTGVFGDFQGSITYDPKDPASFKADAAIQVKSIDTRLPKRDDHLRSPDFFDAEKFPTITFTAKKLDKQDTQTVLAGDLTMKGVTKEVFIPVTIAGPVQGMNGASVIGLSGSFTLNRQDYGVSWNKALDNGGFVVSDDVKVNINIEAHQNKQ